MTPPSDGQRLLLTVLSAAWLAAFAYACLALAMDASNRWSTFLGWQAIAGLLAIAVFGVSRAWRQGSAVRRMAAVPIVLAVAILAVVILGSV